MSAQLQERYPLQVWAQNPLLRTPCVPVQKINKEVKEFGLALLELMRIYDGVWLAAPQVGKTIRMAAFTQRDTTTQPRTHTYEDVMINPKILSQSQETDVDSEWCLSLPWVTWSVARPREITVAYTDLDGKQQIRKAHNYNARIILHEIDHLDGVLFTDKLV